MRLDRKKRSRGERKRKRRRVPSESGEFEATSARRWKIGGVGGRGQAWAMRRELLLEADGKVENWGPDNLGHA